MLEQPPADPKRSASEQGDASKGEVWLYAFGNIESAIADNFPNVLKNVMVVAMHVNPLLIGLILGIKTLWDSVTDPFMAYVTDNTRTRWGRRRPYILVGGVSRISLLVLLAWFLPTGNNLSPNAVMEAQKFVGDSITQANKGQSAAIQILEELPTADPAKRERLLGTAAELVASSEEAFATIAANQPALRDEADAHATELASAREALDSVGEQSAQNLNFDDTLEVPAPTALTGIEKKIERSQSLIDRSVMAQRRAIAAEFVARHVRQSAGAEPDTGLADRAAVQSAADAEFAAEGLDPLDIFSFEKPPPPKPSPKQSMFASIADGFGAFWDPENAGQRSLIVYVLFGFLLFTTFTTVQSVPYYALGIELSPSYDGRTRVVTYRAIMNKVAGLVQPWVPVFCFSLMFATAVDGLFWVAVFAWIIGVPSTVLMCWFTKERTQVSAKKPSQREGIFTAMWQVTRNRDFLRIFALYWFIGLTNGIFGQIGFYLNVYWVTGSALSGATLAAWVSMVAWGTSFACLPLIQWGCRRFQKHQVLMVALIWMSLGTAMKWWLMDPEHPEYQFVLPFFFSAGIASVFTILPTMMADVTDVDELRNGFRREGMFGAMMAFLMKMVATATPILAGAVLVIAGFDPALEYAQTPETILWMRLMYSFIPAGMLLLALLMLWRYPLTRERVEEIKEQLRRRHEGENPDGISPATT